MLALGLAGTMFAAAMPLAARATAIPGEVVVRYEPGTGAADRARARAGSGATLVRRMRLPRTELLKVRPAAITTAVADLRRRMDVAWAEPNQQRRAFLTPADEHFGMQWGLQSTGQVVNLVPGLADADIDAPEAWDLTEGSAGVVIAIVDTGIGEKHPDFAGSLWHSPREIANGLDDDGNGKIDDLGGWDWVDDDATPADEAGHGTHVAGIAAGRGDATGISGVARHATIMPLRVLDAAGSGSSADSADAFAYAAANGARIVNASYGGGYSQAEADAIAAAPDTLFVAAAGNDALDVDVLGAPFPCRYPQGNVICVGGSSRQDGITSSSNTGPVSVDLAAPGEVIASTDTGSKVRSDTFDGWPGGWTTGGLHSEWAAAPGEFTGQALFDSPSGSYAPAVDSFAAMPLVSLTGRHGCRLAYHARVSLGAGDELRFEAETPSVPAETVSSHTGAPSQTAFSFPIPPDFDGASDVTIRVRLIGDGDGSVGDGAEIDDIGVSCQRDNYWSPGLFTYRSGTSMAAPHVSGAAALLWAAAPSATVSQVRAALLESTDPLPAWSGRSVTGGRLNARRAVEAILAATAPPAPPAAPPSTADPGGAPSARRSPGLGPPRAAPLLRLAAAPRRSLSRALGTGVLCRVTAEEPVVARCALLLGPRTAQRLGVPGVLAQRTRTLRSTGSVQLILRPTRAIRRRLAGRRLLRVAVRATATGATGRTTTRLVHLSLRG